MEGKNIQLKISSNCCFLLLLYNISSFIFPLFWPKSAPSSKSPPNKSNVINKYLLYSQKAPAESESSGLSWSQHYQRLSLHSFYQHLHSYFLTFPLSKMIILFAFLQVLPKPLRISRISFLFPIICVCELRNLQ